MADLKAIRSAILGGGLLIAVLAGAMFWAPRALSKPAEITDASLLDGYRHVEVASVSDAMEKLTGQRT